MTLDELIERVERAIGADRKIDAAISEIVGLPQAFFAGHGVAWEDVDGPEFYLDHASWGGEGSMWTAPLFTSSLDAIVGLIEAKLPEANCYGVEKDLTEWIAFVKRDGFGRGDAWLFETYHATSAPLALCAAFLKALRALQQRETA